MTSSKQSETDYNQFVASLNEQNHQSYSTPEPHSTARVICRCSSNTNLRSRTKSSESTSTALLSTILERYEKTVRDRQHAMIIANEQLADVSDLLKRYQGKVEYCQATSSSSSTAAMRNTVRRNEKRNEALQSVDLVRALDFNSFFLLFLLFDIYKNQFLHHFSVCLIAFFSRYIYIYIYRIHLWKFIIIIIEIERR